MSEQKTTFGSLQLKNEESIRAALGDVRNNSTKTNFLLIGYVGNEKNKLELICSGFGGVDELRNILKPEFLGFAYLRIDDSNTPKFVQVSYVGDKVPLVKKGKVGLHAGCVTQLFTLVHFIVSATAAADLSEQDLILKVRNISEPIPVGLPFFPPPPPRLPTPPLTDIEGMSVNDLIPDPKDSPETVQLVRNLFQIMLNSQWSDSLSRYLPEILRGRDSQDPLSLQGLAKKDKNRVNVDVGMALTKAVFVFQNKYIRKLTVAYEKLTKGDHPLVIDMED